MLPRIIYIVLRVVSSMSHRKGLTSLVFAAPCHHMQPATYFCHPVAVQVHSQFLNTITSRSFFFFFCIAPLPGILTHWLSMVGIFLYINMHLSNLNLSLFCCLKTWSRKLQRLPNSHWCQFSSADVRNWACLAFYRSAQQLAGLGPIPVTSLDAFLLLMFTLRIIYKYN